MEKKDWEILNEIIEASYQRTLKELSEKPCVIEPFARSKMFQKKFKSYHEQRLESTDELFGTKFDTNSDFITEGRF